VDLKLEYSEENKKVRVEFCRHELQTETSRTFTIDSTRKLIPANSTAEFMIIFNPATTGNVKQYLLGKAEAHRSIMKDYQIPNIKVILMAPDKDQR
jgi:hypothetical protein